MLALTVISGIYGSVLSRHIKYKDTLIEMFTKAVLAQGFPIIDNSQSSIMPKH